MFDWLDGGRTFELAYGAITGAACLALAVPLLWWALPSHRRSVFGTRVDPDSRLQLAYGIFCMAMACTNVACRAIDHGPLPWVHPTFFLITLLLVLGLAPRLVVVGARRRTPQMSS